MKNVITYLKTLWGAWGNLLSNDAICDCRITRGVLCFLGKLARRIYSFGCSQDILGAPQSLHSSPSGLDAKWKQKGNMEQKGKMSTSCLLLASYLPLTCPLHFSYAAVSSFSLASLICLCMLTVGVGNVWADTYTLGWGDATGSNSTNFTDVSGSVTNVVSFSTAKNDATNAPFYSSSSNYLRLYYHSGGNGGSITLTPASDVTITAFTITTKSKPTTKYKVGSGALTAITLSGGSSPYTGSVSGLEVTSSSSITIQNCNTSNTKLDIATITITYSTSGGGGGGCTAGVASSISAGDVVLIYYPSVSKEFGGYAESGTSHWGDVHTYTTNPSGYYPFTVEAGSASGYWSFKNGTTYLAMSADDNNKLVGSAIKNDASSWSVSINGSGEATITNKAYTGRVLKYNTSSPRFSSYETSTANTAWPKIYKFCDDVKYHVTYYGNENTGGTVPTDNNEYIGAQSATVLGNTGTLVKTGYAWAGWNTKADGNGTTYTAGNSISMSGGSVALYAKWVPTYTVTWMVNGSEARTDNNIGSGTALTPPTISPLPCGDKLAGWTDAEGGNYTHGTSTLYTGATITITGDKTFYAVFADYAIDE